MSVTRFVVSSPRLTLYLQLYRCLDRDSFVEAIAPKEDLTKIGRAQFAILFKVADGSKRGLVSWDDFAVFQTLLKRPDADYWIAFQYFDVYVHYNIPYVQNNNSCPSDSSGTITFDEFKNVFSSNLGPDSIPFNFDWYGTIQIINTTLLVSPP